MSKVEDIRMAISGLNLDTHWSTVETYRRILDEWDALVAFIRGATLRSERPKVHFRSLGPLSGHITTSNGRGIEPYVFVSRVGGHAFGNRKHRVRSPSAFSSVYSDPDDKAVRDLPEIAFEFVSVISPGCYMWEVSYAYRRESENPDDISVSKEIDRICGDLADMMEEACGDELRVLDAGARSAWEIVERNADAIVAESVATTGPKERQSFIQKLSKKLLKISSFESLPPAIVEEILRSDPSAVEELADFSRKNRAYLDVMTRQDVSDAMDLAVIRSSMES